MDSIAYYPEIFNATFRCPRQKYSAAPISLERRLRICYTIIDRAKNGVLCRGDSYKKQVCCEQEGRLS